MYETRTDKLIPLSEMRYFIELEYRGTAYHGWQTQANGSSVQQTLETALSQRLGQPIYTTGSGRTDAGVHAQQQFAHFDLDEPLSLSAGLLHSINCMLPDDIAIRTIFPVRPDDHARFSATERYYQYHISRWKDAFQPGLTCYFRPLLDVPTMNQACRILRQYDDFQSFAKARADVTNFRCRLDFAHWQRTDEHRLTFHIRANRFLWGMVRTIVGAMMEIGQGRMDLSRFEQIIRAKDRSVLGRPAPASGLHLMAVIYPADVLAQRVLLD